MPALNTGWTKQIKTLKRAPNYKGKLNVNGKEYDIAGWVRQGKSGNFLSLTIAEPFKKDSDLPKQTTYNKPKDTGDLPF